MGGAGGGSGGGGGGGGGPCRLQVQGLHVNISEDDLKAVFEPFGETDFIAIEKDGAGKSMGSGYVQYRQTQHAVLAVSQLNGRGLHSSTVQLNLSRF
jgi:RNA-binding protein 39